MKIFNTPVLFLVFNRPEKTKRVFSIIKLVKPPRLFIAADGPRENILEDLEKCKQVREITKLIDWKCEVNTLFRKKNLGCKIAVSSAIDWFFSQIEEGIILEDDCLPSQSFFLFCQEMLWRYRDDKRIMIISGTNPLGSWKEKIQSYHFSVYGGIWGWATWKRAWDYYDVDMKLWSKKKEKEKVRKMFTSKYQYKLKSYAFDRTFNGEINTWDYQWSFARLRMGGLAIIPAVNLIENIGFGKDATHTKSGYNALKITVQNLRFPLKYHGGVGADRSFDKKYFNKKIGKKQLVRS